MDLKQILKTTLLALLTLPTAVAAVEVNSGEHADFSRLVFRVKPGTTWMTTQEENTIKIKLSKNPGNLDTSQIFKKIPKNRISKVIYSTLNRELSVELACKCTVEVTLFKNRYLIVDAAQKRLDEVTIIHQPQLKFPVSLKKKDHNTFPHTTLNGQNVRTHPLPSTAANSTHKRQTAPSEMVAESTSPEANPGNSTRESRKSLNIDANLTPTQDNQHIQTLNLSEPHLIDHITTPETLRSYSAPNTSSKECQQLKTKLFQPHNGTTNYQQEIGAALARLAAHQKNDATRAMVELSILYLRYGMAAEARYTVTQAQTDTIETSTIAALSDKIIIRNMNSDGIRESNHICNFAQAIIDLPGDKAAPTTTPDSSIKQAIAAHNLLPEFLQIALFPIISVSASKTEYALLIDRNTAARSQAIYDQSTLTGYLNRQNAHSILPHTEDPEAENDHGHNFHSKKTIEGLIREFRGRPIEDKLKLILAEALTKDRSYESATPHIQGIKDPDLKKDLQGIFQEVARNASDVDFLRFTFQNTPHLTSFMSSEAANLTRQRLAKLGYTLVAPSVITMSATDGLSSNVHAPPVTVHQMDSSHGLPHPNRWKRSSSQRSTLNNADANTPSRHAPEIDQSNRSLQTLTRSHYASALLARTSVEEFLRADPNEYISDLNSVYKR